MSSLFEKAKALKAEADEARRKKVEAAKEQSAKYDSIREAVVTGVTAVLKELEGVAGFEVTYSASAGQIATISHLGVYVAAVCVDWQPYSWRGLEDVASAQGMEIRISTSKVAYEDATRMIDVGSVEDFEKRMVEWLVAYL